MTKTDYYLNIALAVANKSTCLKKHYGAVIVNGDEIVATGFNGPPRCEAHCISCTKAQGTGDMDEYYSCPAPFKYVIESFCDMLGASKAYNPDNWALAYFYAIGARNVKVSASCTKNLLALLSFLLLSQLNWVKKTFVWYNECKTFLQTQYESL